MLLFLLGLVDGDLRSSFYNLKPRQIKMKACAILGLRSLTSRIHPPLSLSPRESQQLLSLLNASFRRQLDRDHLHNSASEVGVADNHIRSILSSPLFTSSRTRPQPSANLKPAQSGSSIEGIQHLVSNPMEHLRQQVAEGVANLETARQCLHACMKNWTALQQDETNMANRPAKICSPILHWLWSRGSLQSLDFLEDKRFLGLLIPFLVLEGRKQVIRQWLQMLSDTVGCLPVGGKEVPTQVPAQATLLKLYIKSIIQYGGGLGEALTEFLTIVNKASTWVYPDSSWIPSVLAPTGKGLAFLLTRSSSATKCNLHQYTAFLRALDIWGSPATTAYFSALLPLHHPLNPDAAPSLRYLQARSFKNFTKSSAYSRQRIVLLCLDTAQILLSIGHQTDASWVMGFLQDNFAEEIGCGQSSYITDAFTNPKVAANETPETTSLRLLEQLAVY